MTALELCKVLIVDDELLIRQGIKHFMNWENEGFHIVGEASNGKEALERIEELQPHIVITDIVMPVMDGEELTKQIKQSYPDIEVIVLSSFGEFDYVRSTFQQGVADYILKPKLDMQHLLTVLRMTAERISSLQAGVKEPDIRPSLDRYLEGLLNGFEPNAEKEAEWKAALPFDRFWLVGIDLRSSSGKKAEGGLTKTIAAQRLKDGLLQRLEGRSAAIYELPNEESLVAFMINANKLEAAFLQNEVRQIPGWMAIEEEFRYPVALSADFGSLSELAGMYRDSLLACMNYFFYLPELRVLLADDLPARPEALESFHLNQFTEQFKREHFKEAFDDLRSHVEEMTRQYTMDVFEFKSFLGNIIFNITVLLGNMEYDVGELEKGKYRYFKGIEDAVQADEAAAKLEAFVNEAKACIAGKAAKSNQANMKRLLAYIEEHYADAITLTEMAKHFHFNPSYLSNYFSMHNEEGFVEYVHKVRIGKAEELLRKGEATISEISGMVGFSDHSYFCKVFKKQTGSSPSKYRRMHRGDERNRL
ncbi:response regulator transcription factor [Paenibacillus sp. HB172176]|uniref:response regulator transcription factor n=1 Tax=Paenibacillus sp. HB172176 TaxID=2493690 RepID=UPI001439AFC4|nr:response regulator transcription factor [Paenibacillus sp. HB172176]